MKKVLVTSDNFVSHIKLKISTLKKIMVHCHKNFLPMKPSEKYIIIETTEYKKHIV